MPLLDEVLNAFFQLSTLFGHATDTVMIFIESQRISSFGWRFDRMRGLREVAFLLDLIEDVRWGSIKESELVLWIPSIIALASSLVTSASFCGVSIIFSCLLTFWSVGFFILQ